MSAEASSQSPSQRRTSPPEFDPGGGELLQLQRSAAVNPEDVELQKRYGNALARLGKFDEALACWFRVEELRPEEADAARMIAKLIILKNRWRAAHPVDQHKATRGKTDKDSRHADEPSEGFRRLYRSSKRKEGLKRREIQLTEWQKLEHEIEENPSNAQPYLLLVDHYLRDGNEYHAERLLTKGLVATDNDPQLVECLEDVRLRRSKKKLELAERRVSMEDTESAKQELAQTRHDHDQLELQVYTQRSQRQPADCSLKYELGLRLKQVGDHEQAYSRFQEALEDPDCRAAASLEIGACLQRMKRFPDALQFYRQAAELASDSELLECKKLALYRAGSLAAGMKLTEAAHSYFSELVHLDPLYKDVAQKLTELGGRGNSPAT